MPGAANPIAVCLTLVRAISRSHTVQEISDAALDALARGLGVSRSAVVLFDCDGVNCLTSFRGLSENYRNLVQGHTPWPANTPNPQPVVVSDVATEPSLQSHLPIVRAEDIAAMAFVPLVGVGGAVGNLILHYDAPYSPSDAELELAGVVAAQVAFAVQHTRADDKIRRSEEGLRFALDAASMGTWEWALATQSVRWSENLERIHGLQSGAFDGTFDAFQREIHPDDRERVIGAVRRAVEEGAPFDVEYRIVTPDGAVLWLEGVGRVEHENGRPLRMTGVCMDVTRRKDAELARLAAAEEASRLKDEFLATLSHELRTPLHSILGWVQILQSQPTALEYVAEATDVIGRNARHQAQLIEDILDVSRIITGKLDIERVPVLVPQLVDTAIRGILPAAKAKGVWLSRDVPDRLPPIEGDPKRLQQVLGNLLSNAIKFTPEGGRVSVTCVRDGDSIAIDVRDSGIGIAAEFLPFVFDRFRQADSRSIRKHGGLGLGLAIARHLVEQHQGVIQASSDGPGRGATFTIRLPVGSAVQAVAAGSKYVVEHVRLDGVRVLVVDDQEDARRLLATLFRGCGADVLQCESAVTALDVLSTTTVHLLIADVAMPEVDGYELIQRIRRTGNRLPAVAVSAYARLEDRSEAFAAGYNGYCAKPVDTRELLQIVEAVLTRT